MIQYIDATTGEVLDAPLRHQVTEHKDIPRHSAQELTRLRLGTMRRSEAVKRPVSRRKAKDGSVDYMTALHVYAVIVTLLWLDLITR